MKAPPSQSVATAVSAPVASSTTSTAVPSSTSLPTVYTTVASLAGAVPIVHLTKLPAPVAASPATAVGTSTLKDPPQAAAFPKIPVSASRLKAPPLPAVPVNVLPHKQATAKELWDAGRPSVYGGLDQKKYDKTKHLNKKMSLEDFLKIHFEVAKDTEEDFQEWYNKEALALQRMSNRISDYAIRHKGRLNRTIINLKHEYRTRLDYHRTRGDLRRKVRDRLIKEWKQHIPAKVIALRSETDNSKFSALAAWIDLDDEIHRCVLPVKQDWVESKFTKLTVNRVISHPKTEDDGFFPVPETEVVNGEMIELDTRKIVKIMFEPPKPQPTPTKKRKLPKGKNKNKSVYPGRYGVKLSDGEVEIRQEAELIQLFGLTFINHLKQKTIKYGINWYGVPIGAVMDRPALTQEIIKQLNLRKESPPEIRYKQGNQDTCVFSSCASAMFYANELEVAQKLHEFRVPLRQDYNNRTYSEVGRLMCIIKKIFSRKFQWRRLKENYPILTGGRDGGLDRNSICTILVESDDGSCNHAVTIFNNWIFDSNEDHAIPFCAAGLNFITTTKESP